MPKSEPPRDPHGQEEYQVRLEWGLAGLRTVAPGADVVVIVDVLQGDSGTSADAAALAAAGWPDATRSAGPLVLQADLRNRQAVARFIRARQAQKDGRFTVAIVAAGSARSDGSLRFAVEDQLAAGALVDALADLGIDFHSPEAAAACASFTTLRRAVGQLVRASASGRELIAQGRADEIALACQLDSSDDVPVISELGFCS